MNGEKNIRRALSRKEKNNNLRIGMTCLLIFGIVTIIAQYIYVTTKTETYYTEYGAWENAITDVDAVEVKRLEDENKDVGIISTNINSICDIDNQSFHIGSINEEARTLGRIKLIDGNWAQGNKEVVLTTFIKEQLGPEIEVGDIISLPIEDMVSGKTVIMEYELVGIVEHWYRNWSVEGFAMPDIIISDLDQYESTNFLMYHHGQQVPTEIIKELTFENSNISVIYNKDSYQVAKSIADDYIETGLIVWGILVIAALITFYLLSGNKKRELYKIMVLHGIGGNRFSIYKIVMGQALFLLLQAIIISMVLGLVLGGILLHSILDIGILQGLLQVNWLYIFIIVGAISCIYIIGYILIIEKGLSLKIYAGASEESINIDVRTMPKPNFNNRITLCYLYTRHLIFNRTYRIFSILISVVMITATFLSLMEFIFNYTLYTNVVSRSDYTYNLMIYDNAEALSQKELDSFLEIPKIIKVDGDYSYDGNQEGVTVRGLGWEKNTYVEKYNEANTMFTNDENDSDLKDYLLLRELDSIATIQELQNTSLSEHMELLDFQAFEDGEQCILVLPPFYLETDAEWMGKIAQPLLEYEGYEGKEIFEYDSENSSIQVGDYISIGTSEIEESIMVAGIITEPGYDFDVIVSDNFLSKLTGQNTKDMYNKVELTYDSSAIYNTIDWEVQSLVEEYIENENSYELQNSRKNAEVVATIHMNQMIKCIVIVFIVWILFLYVLYLGMSKKLENDTQRINTLHRIGMSRKQLWKLYLIEIGIEGGVIGIVGILGAIGAQIFIWCKDSGYPDIAMAWEYMIEINPINQYMPIFAIGLLAVFFLSYLFAFALPLWKVIKKI